MLDFLTGVSTPDMQDGPMVVLFSLVLFRLSCFARLPNVKYTNEEDGRFDCLR